MLEPLLRFFGLRESQPTIYSAFKVAEDALKKLEVSSYILQDTEEWKRFKDDDAREFHKDEVRRWFKDTHLHMTRYRDAVNLARQALPKKVRKVNG
jgi:hypothetical protein